MRNQNDTPNLEHWLISVVITALSVALLVGKGNKTGLDADCASAPCYGHGYMFD